MNDDLRIQLADYGRHHRREQRPVGLDEIVARDRSVRPVPVSAPARTRWRGVAVAASTAALVVLLVGVIPFLIGSDGGRPPAATVATTGPRDTVDASPSADGHPTFDPGSMRLPLVAEVITQSSVGDVVWRVYESAGEEQSHEIMGPLATHELADAGAGTDPSLAPDEVFVSDGVVIDISRSALGSVAGSHLTEWRVSFDPIATTMLGADEGLVERSADGRLLGLGEVTGGTVDVVLYATEADAELSDHKPGALTNDPIDVVARYRLDTRVAADGTVLRVSDADTGQPIGSVTATITLPAELSIWWGFPLVRRGEYYVAPDDAGGPLMTLSDDGSVEFVRPDWAADDYDGSLSTATSLLVFIEPADSPPGGETMEIWGTPDGKAWANLGAPNGWPSGYGEPEFREENGTVVVQLNDQVGDGPDLLLTSPNGIDWVPVTALPSGTGRLVRIGGGFAWVGGEQVEVWTSPDGMTWEPMDLSGVPVPRDGLLGGGEFAGGVWFHQSAEVERLWILEFTGSALSNDMEVTP